MTVQRVEHDNQFAGVMRVMNTTSNGMSVQGLEVWIVLVVQDLTESFRTMNSTNQYVIAVTNHHVVGGSRTVNCNYHFNNIPAFAYVVATDHKNDIALLALDVHPTAAARRRAFRRGRRVDAGVRRRVRARYHDEMSLRGVSLGVPESRLRQAYASARIR